MAGITFLIALLFGGVLLIVAIGAKLGSLAN